MTSIDDKSLFRSTEKYQSMISTSYNKTEHTCPQCNHAIEEGALFCAECGVSLKAPLKCPKCGAVTQPRADICEACGEWLLKGQCKFCYAPINEDEAFCGECGNPEAGITCPKCAKLSIFDFCKTCGIPLSVQAKQMMQEAVRNPVFQDIAAAFEPLSDRTEAFDSEAKPIDDNADVHLHDHTDQTSELKAYRESFHSHISQDTPKLLPRALFTSAQKKSINQLSQEVADEEERRRIEEERRRREEERKRREEEDRRRREEERRRKEEERRKQEEARRREHERKLQEQFNTAMNQIRGKTFSSNQEARRFFMSIVAGLPEELANKITNRGLSWRCNAYDCVHDSPSDCADPSRGGVWLIR